MEIIKCIQVYVTLSVYIFKEYLAIGNHQMALKKLKFSENLRQVMHVPGKTPLLTLNIVVFINSITQERIVHKLSFRLFIHTYRFRTSYLKRIDF